MYVGREEDRQYHHMLQSTFNTQTLPTDESELLRQPLRGKARQEQDCHFQGLDYSSRSLGKMKRGLQSTRQKLPAQDRRESNGSLLSSREVIATPSLKRSQLPQYSPKGKSKVDCLQCLVIALGIEMIAGDAAFQHLELHLLP